MNRPMEPNVAGGGLAPSEPAGGSAMPGRKKTAPEPAQETRGMVAPGLKAPSPSSLQISDQGVGGRGERASARARSRQPAPMASPAYGGGDVAAVTVTDTTVVAAVWAELARVRAEIEVQAQQFHETLANLEIVVLDGYLVKVWPDPKLGVWIAHCPTVRCVVQEATRDEVVAAAVESIREMLGVLAEMGADLPPKDVSGAR